MIDFRGRVALVTGGSRGIGRACALQMARLGARVAINYRENEAAAERVACEARAMGTEALTFRADVTREPEVAELARSVIADFGRIDVLVNSAGISQIVSVPDLRDEDWDRMMAVNVKGTFFCCQHVLEHMVRRGGGRIVNVSSTAGQMGGFIVGVNYSASKAAVICMTKSLAKYAVAHGVTVNCVAPGLIDTEMTSAYPPERVASLVASIPMGRMGAADEVANSVVFLASDAASYITGITLYVNGGTYMG